MAGALSRHIFFLFVAATALTATAAYPQTSELIQQRLLQQGQTQAQASGTVPTLGRDQGSVRTSDLLPDAPSLVIPPQSEILLDHPVDPGTYVTGPGDLIGIYLWGRIQTGYQVRVSPEGYIVIPSVGTLFVAGRTLTDIDTDLRSLLQKNYQGLEATLYLIEPRRFRLSVSGMVYLPGMHETHALERVSDVMDRAGFILPGENYPPSTQNRDVEGTVGAAEPRAVTTGPTAEERSALAVIRRAGTVGRTSTAMLSRSDRSTQSSVTPLVEPFSLGEGRGSSVRSIIIHRGDTTLTADLLRFLKLGDMTSNPYLRSGDRIEVPSYRGDISAVGEVQEQGTYEFRDGDRICDLIRFCGGLTALADSSAALLVSFSADGRSLVESTINLTDALMVNPNASAYRLKEADRLYIRTKRDYHEQSDVTISGEVRYPGQYPIARRGAMLSEVIRLAGGITEDANLEETRLIRERDFATTDVEYERLKSLSIQEMTSDERDYYRSVQRTMEGSFNIDFVKLFKDGDTSLDVEMKDGDILYVPVKREFVNVLGAVREPGNIKARLGATYRDYIKEAGGLNWNAEKRNVYLLKARTNQRYNLRYDKDVPVEAGDTIHIVERPQRNFWSYFREYSGYATTLATVALVVVQLSN